MARQVWPQLAWLQVPHRKDRLPQLLLLLRPVLLVLLRPVLLVLLRPVLLVLLRPVLLVLLRPVLRRKGHHLQLLL
jgi:hypothetical protein